MDNYAKLILDCCNGLLWDDDHCIVQLVIMKTYSDTPHEEVIVEQAQAELTTYDKIVMSRINQSEVNDIIRIMTDLVENENTQHNRDLQAFGVRGIRLLAERYGDQLALIGKALRKEKQEKS